MKKLLIKNKAVITYFLVAATGVIVQYIVSSYCLRYLDFEFQKAVSTGFIVSVPIGFILSKIFAFEAKGSGNTTREMIKYGFVLIISWLITVKGAYYALQILTHFFGDFRTTLPFMSFTFSPIGSIAQFTGMGLSFIFNFVTHRKFTFVETGIYDKVKEKSKLTKKS